MVNSVQHVTHCIFDMDGLLLDTERLYDVAIQSILDNFDKTYTWEVKVTLMGCHHNELAQRIVAAYDLPISWQDYSKLQKEATAKIMIEAELLPDTEPIYEEITRQIAAAFNIDYAFEVRMKLLGTTERRSAEIAIEGLKLPLTIDEYLSQYKKMCLAMLDESPLMKGAERLLRHLHSNNIPIALATSSSIEMVELKTTHHRELFKLFSHQVCGSTDPDVKEGKPAPDIFLVAASRFADTPQPAKCLVFEDAPNGVQAACSAGMQVIMAPDERVPAEMRTKATRVLKSLEDFKPEEFGLPPFPSSC